MNRQMTFGEVETLTEDSVYALLQPSILNVFDQNNIDRSHLIMNCGDQYSSVFLCSNLAFRIRVRRKTNYIAVKSKYKSQMPLEIAKKKMADDFICYDIKDLNDVKTLIPHLMCVVDAEIDCIPRSDPYDCCSQYLECSNSKKCVNPRKDSSMSCGYKKILKSGRIFYGKNRNVDNERFIE